MIKTLGVIGPGKHFIKNIYPSLIKSDFFQLNGILRKKNTSFNNIKLFDEKNFFKKKFDFIYISCPNKYHEKYILKSLESNSHVICEKPFLIKRNNLNKILELSKMKKKLIFETFMFLYHPVFNFIKNIIKDNRYGKLEYLISNFRFPSLNKNNHRYNSQGGGFFLDAACYLLALENHLFDKNNSSSNYYFQNIKNKFPLRGNIIIRSDVNRYYFWGEGQNYSNNLEIFFNNASIFIDKFFSKKKNEGITAKIHFNNKIIIKKFKRINHFEEMFKVIKKNYNNSYFQSFHRNKIENQLNLLIKNNKY
jgi:predicted dehydrogenase